VKIAKTLRIYIKQQQPAPFIKDKSETCDLLSACTFVRA